MHIVRFKKQAGYGLAVGLIATFIPVLLLEISSFRLNGTIIYPVDDTFIHMQLAKNLAFHGNWGINSHEFGAASSSLLYTLLLALLSRIFSAHMILPLVVNCIAGIILLIVLNKWLLKQQLSTLHHVLVMLVVVFFTPLPIMIISGMEHTLQCLFSFLFLFHGAHWIAKHSNTVNHTWRLPWQMLLYALLVTAIRYEGLFLVGMFCIALIYFRQFGAALKIASAALLPVVIFGLYSISRGSFFLPNSVLIKSGEVPLFGGGPVHFFTTLLVEKLTLIKPGITLLATQRLLLLLPLTYLFFKKQRRFYFSDGIVLIILTATALLHLSLASTGKFYRYEAYLIFCATIIMAAVLCRNGSELYRSMKMPSRVMAATLLFFLFFPVILRSTAAFSKAKQACINIYEQQYQMGGFLSTYYPSATVAANDIGAVSFFSKGEVIDLWGLGSIEIAKSRKEHYWTSGFLDSFARKKNTKLAMIYDSWFDPSPGTLWTKVGSWQIRNNVVCGDDLVSFYAVDSSEADQMKKNFRAYSQEKLPRSVLVKYY